VTDEIRRTPRGSKSKGVNVTMPRNHLAKIRSVAFDEPKQTSSIGESVNMTLLEKPPPQKKLTSVV
jgi:hypothetical protein